MFTNREPKLALLDRLCLSNQAELFLLYGRRRRIGIGEFLHAFCAGKPHRFSRARVFSGAEPFAAFSQAMWAHGHATAPEGFTFPSREAAFGALSNLLALRIPGS